MTHCLYCQHPLDKSQLSLCRGCLDHQVNRQFGPQIHLFYAAVQSQLQGIDPAVTRQSMETLSNAQHELGETVRRIIISRLPHAPTDSQVTTEATIWHAFDAAVDRYEARVSDIVPLVEFLSLFQSAIDALEYYRHLCRISCGRHQMTFEDIKAFVSHIMAAQRHEIISQGYIAAILDAQQQGKAFHATVHSAVVAMRQALFRGLIMQIKHHMARPIPEVQESAAITLAGWVKTHMRVHKSILTALARDGERFADRLLEEVWITGQTLPPEGDLPTFVNTVRKQVGQARQNQKTHAPRDNDDPLKNDPARQVEAEDLMRKDSLYYEELFERAGLTRDERDSFRLKLRNSSVQDIANLLGKSLSAIKQDLLRARKKLKQMLPE